MRNNIPTDPDEVSEEFKEYMDENNYCYFDSFERLIHLPTKKLHSFTSVYERFLQDTGRDQTDFQRRMLNDLKNAIAV